MSKVSIDVIRRVYQDDEGVFLEVSPDPDIFGIRVHATKGKNSEWFGDVDFSVSKDVARALGMALIRCADDPIEKVDPT